MRGPEDKSFDWNKASGFIAAGILILFFVAMGAIITWSDSKNYDRDICRDATYLEYLYDGYEVREAWAIARGAC